MTSFWKKLLRNNPKEKIDPMKKYLIVGLGNPGMKYKNSRHNIGFKILDGLAKEEGLDFSVTRHAERSEFRFKGRLFILIKPTTMMNLSGKAVRYWMQKENIPIKNLLVISDDLNIPFGEIRLKGKGSDGGHNGLKDIQQKLGTTKYSRFRFGIGNSYSKGKQVNYVLGQWSLEEEQDLKERIEKSIALIKSYGTAGLNQTMNAFNGK